ncbi:MAG TPA: hypothetical protein VLH56_12050 [Dissulfurispiraceae bacterium]|nr:hypothetical protein [Dissulfurispiraceae bacterium]
MRLHKEKTPGRQTAVGITGFVVFLVVALVTQWDVLFPTHHEGSPHAPAAQSFLAGMIEPHDTSLHECTLSPDGILTLGIKAVGESPAECCVRMDSPRELRERSEFLAVLVPDKAFDEVRLMVQSTEGRSILLHRRGIYGSENAVRVTFDKQEHLGGKESLTLAKFCIAIPRTGEQRFVKVKKAVVTPAR